VKESFHRAIRFLAVLGLAMGLAMSGPAEPAPVLAQTKASASEPEPVKALGVKGAPITMEVFSDFQCPACRDLFLQTLKPLIQNYVVTGKVYLIHRDMPLPMHKHARVAARYANAAARVGKLEKVTEALYLSQDFWGSTGDVETILSRVLTPAEMTKVREALKDGKIEAGINKDVELAGRHQVRSTPTTIITHRGKTTPVVGVVSYSILRQYIEQLLRQ